ncbi:MAG: flagellar hook-associated protein FlgK [Myxococcota bacterium]
MAGLFGVLDLASRGMFVVQSSIQTTAHNVANVDTPGYSRQRSVLGPAAAIATGAGVIGTGVELLTIQRITDDFVQAQLVREDSSGSAVRVQAEVLSAVEELLNEQLGGGVSGALSKLYSAFADLASATTPGAPVERQGVATAAQTAVDTFHSLDSQLRDQQQRVDLRITQLVPEINSLLERIAGFNGEIVRQEVTGPANDLRDQRDHAVRELSQLIDVSTFESDDGDLVVMIASGLTAVDGVTALGLAVAPDVSNPFDPTFSRVTFDDGTSQFDITADIGAGSLGGLLRARDTLLPAAIRSLDVLAYNLVTSVNAVQTAGVALDGSSGDFFVPLGAVEDAARDVALDPAIAANPDKIAAGLTPEPGDNRNALALAALRDTASALALPGDPPGPPSGPSRTLLEHAAAVVADIGHQVNGLSAAVDQHDRVLEVLEGRRDQVSGVSLDEEMSNLVRLQAAFQANARVLSVVDRLLQDVVAMI